MHGPVHPGSAAWQRGCAFTELGAVLQQSPGRGPSGTSSPLGSVDRCHMPFYSRIMRWEGEASQHLTLTRESDGVWYESVCPGREP